MNREQIDSLITSLVVVSSYAKDIHYSCKGDNFYGNHLLADRINEGIDEHIDGLKEICLLGHGYQPLKSSQYLEFASKKIPDKISFKVMKEILVNILEEIENINQLSKGDENLIGAIAQDLQNHLGLLNIMLGDTKLV